MASFTDFLPSILPEVQGCPSAIALGAARGATIDLCKKAWVWVEDLDPVSIVTGQVKGVLVPPVDAVVVGVVSAGEATGRDLLPGEDFTAQADAIYLTRATESDVSLLVKAALSPSRAARTLPSFLVEDWMDVIAHGAKGRLMSMAQSWGNAEAAAYNSSRFSEGVINARIQANKGNSLAQGSLRVQLRRFI